MTATFQSRNSPRRTTRGGNADLSHLRQRGSSCAASSASASSPASSRPSSVICTSRATAWSLTDIDLILLLAGGVAADLGAQSLGDLAGERGHVRCFDAPRLRDVHLPLAD